MVETRKQEEKKETTDELMDEQKRTQRGRKEVMHACVWFLNQKEKWMFKKKKTQESEGQENEFKKKEIKNIKEEMQKEWKTWVERD